MCFIRKQGYCQYHITNVTLANPIVDFLDKNIQVSAELEINKRRDRTSGKSLPYLRLQPITSKVTQRLPRGRLVDIHCIFITLKPRLDDVWLPMEFSISSKLVTFLQKGQNNLVKKQHVSFKDFKISTSLASSLSAGFPSRDRWITFTATDFLSSYNIIMTSNRKHTIGQKKGKNSKWPDVFLTHF